MIKVEKDSQNNQTEKYKKVTKLKVNVMEKANKLTKMDPRKTVNSKAI